MRHPVDKRIDPAAFTRGFWKGLASPLALFAPTTAAQLPEITTMDLPKRRTDAASDWVRVGDALRAAIRSR